MDVLLELPLEVILDRTPVAKAIKDALMDRPSPLASVYQLERAYESGNWDMCQMAAAELKLAETDLAESYVDAARWASELQSQSA